MPSLFSSFAQNLSTEATLLLCVAFGIGGSLLMVVLLPYAPLLALLVVLALVPAISLSIAAALVRLKTLLLGLLESPIARIS